jgi:hypothetical protein
MPIRTKYDFERLHKYCDEKSILLLDDYSSSQLKKTFIIKGKCIYNGCQDTFEKNFINLLKHGAYCKKCIKIVSVEKMKKTFLQNYGSENILHLDFVKDKTNPNKFTNDKLINYCKEHNIKLLNDYSNDKLTKKSKIKATCQTLNCNSIVDKIFREIEKKGVYCEICSQQNKQNKRKATCLQKYGVENAISSEAVQTKMKLTNLKKYGVEYTFQSEIVKDKIKEICIEKYGVENASQNKDVREKYKQTCLEKYGVEHISQTDNYKQKYKTTIMKKYGVENISQNESIKKKKVDTCLKNYGVEYPSQHADIKQKKIETSLKHYGVEYPIQNPTVLDKNIKNCYRTKQYTFPSGNIILIQGYENLALDELIKKEKIDEHNIIMGVKNVPNIWYFGNDGKNHRHYVDIFIPTQNRCIEVKSTWTAKLNEHNIYFKQNAAKLIGYKYEIWIYNEKKQLVNLIK